MYKCLLATALLCVAASAASVQVDSVCSQKDQGVLGTCHAFGLSCPVEVFESKRRPGFEVAENWLVFISTLDRLCSNSERRVRVNEGYEGFSNISRMMTLGYCAKKTYSSYSPYDGARSAGQWEPTPAEVDKLLAGDSGRATMARGYMDPYVAQKFSAAFGISPEDAKTALCDGTDAQKRSRISTMNVSREFRACFEESLKAKPTLAQSCRPSIGRESSPSRVVADLKAIIDRGEPAMITIQNYRPRPDNKHSMHFLSIVGYDDARKTFLARNSWGAGQNYPIEYSRVSSIIQYTTLGCKTASPPPVNPPRPHVNPPRPPVNPPQPDRWLRDYYNVH